MTELPVYLLILLVFANRYLLGFFLARARGRNFDARVEGYEPTTTIVVPLYNEGRSIDDTIRSLVHLEYPAEKLEITVVDDWSTDDSYEWACRAAGEHPNVAVMRTPHRLGRRGCIEHAARQTRCEIIVSVDPDLVLLPTALRELVARFSSPQIAAVCGRVHVSNPNHGWLTRLETIERYLGQEHVTHLERSVGSLLRLPGSLAAYRRSVLAQLMPVAEARSVFGLRIPCGDDRLRALQIARAGYRIAMTTDATAFSRAPIDLKSRFREERRRSRSSVIDLIAGLRQAFRGHLLLGLHHLLMVLLLVAYPVIVGVHVARGELFGLVVLHMVVGVAVGVAYQRARSTRSLPPWLRVPLYAFLPVALSTPIAFLFLVPRVRVALDAAGWQASGHLPGAPR